MADILTERLILSIGVEEAVVLGCIDTPENIIMGVITIIMADKCAGPIRIHSGICGAFSRQIPDRVNYFSQHM